MTMFEDIVGLPAQLRWGIGRDVPGLPPDRPVVLLGMGGSAMAARIAVLDARPRVPVLVHSSYGLPPWAVGHGAAILAVSYSGNTEEVLSGVDEAVDAGLPVVGVTSGGRLAGRSAAAGFPLVDVPGGMQPRAGVGYQAAAIAAVLCASGHIADADTDVSEAADVLDGLLDGGDGPAVRAGRELAGLLGDRTAVIYGGYGVGAAAAYRWKTQINENAKRPAYAGTVPEMNHNELEAWHAVRSGPFGVVSLRDEYDHPKIGARLDLMQTVLGGKVAHVGEVLSVGAAPMARFFSLTAVGDVASVALAEADGIDPTPVATLETFKTMLAKGTP